MGYKKRTNKITDTSDALIIEELPEIVPEIVPEIESDITPNNTEMDEVARRKQEIADKRRASLALARSKIVPKSALKKQADEAIKGKDELLRNKQEETDAMRLKYERDRVKTLEDNLMALQKLIAERPAERPADRETKVAEPVAVPEPPKRKQRASRSKEALAERANDKHDVPARQPQHITPKKSIEPRMIAPPSTEKLIDKSYGEQLQERLRSQAIHKIMNDTFGGF
jgi:hypothetical protein